MSQQQRADNVSIDDIPVDINNTQSTEVDSADVPDEIESITRGLAGEQPPTNPIVVLKAVRWWYLHGRGGEDPAFQWAIEWARNLAIDTPSDVERFDEFLGVSSRLALLTNAATPLTDRLGFLNAPEGCGAV